MISFNGEQGLKDAAVARVKEHQRLDQIIQGTYWDGERGCAIGCVLHSYDRTECERQLGVPVFLAYMDEHIFERLSAEDSTGWPLRFIEAVPVGVDLKLVFPRFMCWLLSDPMGIRRHVDLITLPIIETVTKMYEDRLHGIPIDRAAADAAAWAADAAAGKAANAAANAAAWAARAAAYAAADAAAYAAARAADAAAWAADAAAWAADAAAEKAAEKAADAAARAADAAAWAADAAAEKAAYASARAADAAAWAADAAAEKAVDAAAEKAAYASAWAAARAAEIHRQADMLISILQSYESQPVLAYAPCEERHEVRG